MFQLNADEDVFKVPTWDLEQKRKKILNISHMLFTEQGVAMLAVA